ncbi:MAG TPA: VapE domain-containing protein [Rhodanobacter sp.]|nr:VapE domain-containing protein [Rhodanobacter sp.]
MNLIDFAAISASLDAYTVVPQWLPDGKKQGHEWVARNPNRADRSPGSFSVNMKTGKWADFAAGESGGDLVSLYAYLEHHGDQGAAARDLQDTHAVRIDPATRQQAAEAGVRKIDDAKPVPIFPVPLTAPAPDYKHFRFGEPTAVYTYRDGKGRTLLHVVRFDPEGVRKQVVPLSWCNDPKKGERWAWRGITSGKVPMYGLDLLAKYPDADVLVVEGEKTADAANACLSDGMVAVCWLGGTARADSIHLKALHGRRVTLWPDFDAQRVKPTGGEKPESMPLLPLQEQPGFHAMMTIAGQLKGHAQLTMVGYSPDNWPHGWDIADGWTAKQVADYLAENAGDPWDIASGRKVTPEPGAEAEPPKFVPLGAPVNIYGFPDVSAKQAPLGTRPNVAYLMGEYGITARYNEIKKGVEMDFHNRHFFGDTKQENALIELTSLCAKNMLPASMLQGYVKNIATDNAYSPVRDWIESKPWDGVTRIPALLATLTTPAENVPLKNALVTRWLISAVAAAYRPPDFESHGALVFTGPQGKGKTTWFRRLAPSSMGVVMVGASVDPSDKDSVTRVVGHWIVELGELDATFRKADISKLKAFVTQPVDKLRRPYDRLESEYKRQTVFGGSVNEDRYLVDDTGNRRWWTVPVSAVDYLHTIDMQQLWAEVLGRFKAGEQWWLTADETALLNALNEEHEAVDPVKEMIQRRFDFSDTSKLRREELTASEVLQIIGFDKPNKVQATHASKVLRELTGKVARRTNSGRLFDMPRRVGGVREPF